MADSSAKSLGVFSPSVLRRLLVIFVPAALLTGAVVLLLYHQDVAKEHTLYQQAGDHLVNLQAEIIDRELKTVEADVLYLANEEILRDYLSAPDKKKRLEAQYALFCQQRAVYDQIRYLDDKGQEKIRINHNSDGPPIVVPEVKLQNKADRYYFQKTMDLKRGQVFVSPFDLNKETRDIARGPEIEKPLKPCIRFATPVFDEKENKRGIVVLNYLGAVLLRRLAEVSVTFPGSAFLLNHKGYFLRGPAPEDEWGFMLGHERSLASYYPQEWQGLAGLERGQFQAVRGLFTFRSLSLRPQFAEHRSDAASAFDPRDPDVGEAGLIIVSYVPAAELNRRAAQLLHTLLLLAGVVLLVIFVLAWYLAYAAALRREHERQIAESADRLRTLSTQLITAQEDERRSLSRDLHDELGQLVTAVKLDLQRAAQSGDVKKKDELLGRARHGAECLLDSIHEISTRVRPTLLDDLGLKDAVQSYLSEYEQRTGIAARAELHFEQQDVPAVVSENVFRILQEALANVAKHARATEVFVGLDVTGGQAALTVRDGGVGFQPETVDGKRLGLLGMRERAELLDGNFTVKSAAGQGTEIRVSIPVGIVKNGETQGA